MNEPVVPLLANLYGHTLADLLWEKYLEKQLLKIGWTRLRSHECLFIHQKDRLLLSVYVDDLKMVGVAKNIQPMWKKIRELVDLGPETELVDHVYLGCTQRAVPPQRSIIQAKQQLFSQLLSKETSDKKAGVIQTLSILKSSLNRVAQINKILMSILPC